MCAVFSIYGEGDLRNLTVRGNSHVRGNVALADGGAIAVWRIFPEGYMPQPGINGITVADGSSFANNRAFQSGGKYLGRTGRRVRYAACGRSLVAGVPDGCAMHASRWAACL